MASDPVPSGSATPDRADDVNTSDPGASDAASADLQGDFHGDAVEFLLAEHTKFQNLFGELRDALAGHDPDAARLRWPGLAQDLREHEATEQRVLWPVARAHLLDGDTQADERIAEEVVLLERLDAADEHAIDFTARFLDVMELALPHIAAEDEVIPRLREALPPDALRELGQDLRVVKGVE